MTADIPTIQPRPVDWQILGKVELPTHSETENSLRAWLTGSLAPMNFQPELLERMIRSALESMPLESAQRLQFMVLVLKIEGSNGNWGFFRIVKSANASLDGEPAVPIIEFYIYNEV